VLSSNSPDQIKYALYSHQILLAAASGHPTPIKHRNESNPTYRSSINLHARPSPLRSLPSRKATLPSRPTLPVDPLAFELPFLWLLLPEINRTRAMNTMLGDKSHASICETHLSRYRRHFNEINSSRPYRPFVPLEINILDIEIKYSRIELSESQQ